MPNLGCVCVGGGERRLLGWVGGGRLLDTGRIIEKSVYLKIAI